MYAYNETGHHVRVRGVSFPPGRRNVDPAELDHLGDKGIREAREAGVKIVDEKTPEGKARLDADAAAAWADAAALDYCRELKIDPKAVPRKDGERLTQAHVQAYRDQLAEKASKTPKSAPAPDPQPLVLPSDWKSQNKPVLQAYAATQGIDVDQTKADLVAKLETSIETSELVTVSDLTAEQLAAAAQQAPPAE